MTEIPKTLGKYQIIKELGRGSMGVVYEAYDPFINRRVALKVANNKNLRQSTMESYQKAFFNEAYTAGKLRHPNIIEILDASTEGDYCYIVMELVQDGNTLGPYCRDDKLLSYEQVANLISQCALALDYAHRVGVIHRDIKPTNILLTAEMNVKLCDFSIAHLMTEEARDTMPTGFIGSPRYMSPEQVQEDVLTNQTDLFSLGIVMYELLTGKHPFAAQSFSRLIYKITNEEPTPLKHYRSSIPEIFKMIIRHALQKDPENRYKMGADMVADLGLFSDDLDISSDGLEEKKKVSDLQRLSDFQCFSEAELWEIVRACDWYEYELGQQIVTHEYDDVLLVVCQGKIIVRKQGQQTDYLIQEECLALTADLFNTQPKFELYAKEKICLACIKGAVMEKLSLNCQLHFNKLLLSNLARLWLQRL